jgi:hypothetical protein
MVEYEVARRKPRCRFMVDVTVTDVQRRIRINARTTRRLFGCGIDTSKPLAPGTSTAAIRSNEI